MLITQYCTKYMTTIFVKFNKRELVLISVYFPPNEPIEELFVDLQKAITSLKDYLICIGGDINAKSPIWGSPVEQGWAIIFCRGLDKQSSG